ncbi:MAG: Rieske (2Fe-2S) protein [Gemmatimonadaceae bacterium]|nr:Rieske (2Fe-2S) protein [Gemmatimonadaceae bacterium]
MTKSTANIRESGNPEPGAAAECVSCTRRSFLSASMLSAASVLLASACGDGVFGGGITGPGTTVSLTIALADYPALGTIGGMARLNGLATPVVVVRSAASTYLALSLVCPHQGTTVTAQGNGFICPNHRATFSATGAWTGGQRTSGLNALAVTLDAVAGTLLVTGKVGTGGNGRDDDD